MITTQRKGKEPDYPAVCPDHIIEQASAFTAPRGCLEMGGVLIGHVDENGANITVTGFFPEQIEETPGYCMFDGKWMAIAAAACDYANSTIEGDGPPIRVIGWIHTHPDIGIFLSGTDIKTFRQLRNQCPERRFVAVVVDPLRNEHGIFNTELQPNRPEHSVPSTEMSDELAQRYDVFLDRMRTVQAMHGTNALPCILPGPFRYKRLISGDRDDVGMAEKQGLFSIKKAQFDFTKEMRNTENQIVKISNVNQTLSNSHKSLEKSLDQVGTVVRNEEKARKHLERRIEIQENRIRYLENLVESANENTANLTTILGDLNEKITQMHLLLENYELKLRKQSDRLDTVMETNGRMLEHLEKVKKQSTRVRGDTRKIRPHRPVYSIRHGTRMRYRRGP